MLDLSNWSSGILSGIEMILSKSYSQANLEKSSAITDGGNCSFKSNGFDFKMRLENEEAEGKGKKRGEEEEGKRERGAEVWDQERGRGWEF